MAPGKNHFEIFADLRDVELETPREVRGRMNVSSGSGEPKSEREAETPGRFFRDRILCTGLKELASLYPCAKQALLEQTGPYEDLQVYRSVKHGEDRID